MIRFEQVPYTYQEYPKWVQAPGGPVLVHSEGEEQAVLGPQQAQEARDDLSATPQPKRRGRPPKASQ